MPREGIELADVYVSYNGYYAVEGVSLRLESPFYALLLGPNGAGKTTLIKVMVGLLRPSRGYVKIYGVDPWSDRARLSRLVGYMPQAGTSRPSPFIKVEELVAMGYLSLRSPPRRLSEGVWEEVLGALRAMGVGHLVGRRLSELSGGELQRVMVASIMVRRPKLLLLDEPLASLDFNAKCDLVRLLYRLHGDMDVDVLMSTHELTSCLYLEPTVVLINRRVIAVGPAREVLVPDNLKLAYPSMTEVLGLTVLSEDHPAKPAGR